MKNKINKNLETKQVFLREYFEFLHQLNKRELNLIKIVFY